MTTSTGVPFTPTRNPVMVIGYMHSGTTLLYKLLGQSESLFASRGESKYFEFMAMVRRRFPDLSTDAGLRELVQYIVRLLVLGFVMRELTTTDEPRPDPLPATEIDQLCELAREHRDYGAVFRIVFDYLAHRAGKSRWLEKTPTHVFHVDKILATIPDTRFIEITRDPRDVLASKKTRRENVWTSDKYTDEQKAKKHLEKAFDPFWDALGWKSAVTAGRVARENHPDRIKLVRYEDLVANPEHTLREICSFLDLPFDAAMLQVSGGNAADHKASKPRSGIYASSLARWRKTLTPAEVALTQTVLAPELEMLHYETDELSHSARLRALALLPGALGSFTTRVVRRWKMGGTSYARNVLRDYSNRLGILVAKRSK